MLGPLYSCPEVELASSFLLDFADLPLATTKLRKESQL